VGDQTIKKAVRSARGIWAGCVRGPHAFGTVKAELASLVASGRASLQRALTAPSARGGYP